MPRSIFKYSLITNPECMVSIDMAHLGYIKKRFACSTLLSMKFQFQLLIRDKIVKKKSSCFITSDVVFIMFKNVKMPTIVWHFNIYQQDQSHAQLI